MQLLACQKFQSPLHDYLFDSYKCASLTRTMAANKAGGRHQILFLVKYQTVYKAVK